MSVLHSVNDKNNMSVTDFYNQKMLFETVINKVFYMKYSNMGNAKKVNFNMTTG